MLRDGASWKKPGISMQTRMVPIAAAVTKTGRSLGGRLSWGIELTSCSDEEEDETAELLRELVKIKKERAEHREREVFEFLVLYCCNYS